MEKIAQQHRLCQPGHDPYRDKKGCAAILQHFRSLPQNLPARECPSSLELIRDGRFGQRPVNRINDLVLGKFDGHRYDFERIQFGRGQYHWRLHEPARPGYPKHRNQSAITFDDVVRTKRTSNRHETAMQFEREFGKARIASSVSTDERTLFEVHQ